MAYAGSRLETIENNVRDLTNDDDSIFMGQDTQFIRWANYVQRELARSGYWKKETSFNATTSETYDLSTQITDLVKLFALRWYDHDYWLPQYITFPAYAQHRLNQPAAGGGTPNAWFFKAATLYVWPASDSVVTDGWTAYHSYLPTALDTTTNYTPEIPEAYDEVFIYGILWRNCMRDRTRPGYEAEARTWKELYDREFSKLLQQGKNRKVGLIPYR